VTERFSWRLERAAVSNLTLLQGSIGDHTRLMRGRSEQACCMGDVRSPVGHYDGL
jgi:hypothetical protein